MHAQSNSNDCIHEYMITCTLMQAIEHGNLNRLHDSVKQMRKNANGREGYLDVCYLQSVLSPYKRKNTVYCMTLLAHAAVQRNKSMVDVVINYGASKENANILYLLQYLI